MITVIPFYYPGDTIPKRLFSRNQDELDVITGNQYILVCCDPIPGNVTEAVDSKRYLGLNQSDIPCLWVETTGKHFIIPLRNKSSDDINYVLRQLADLIRQNKPFDELSMTMKKNADADPQRTGNIPSWFPIAGVSFSLLTIVFLMYLLLFGPPLDPRKKLIFDFLMAFCTSASAAFLGGSAAASGRIPFFKDSPINFSTYGGIAILVVVFLILHYAS